MTAPVLAPPRDLTIPSAGSSTARAVLSASLRRLIDDLPLVARRAASGKAAAELAEVVRVAREVLAVSPGALIATLRRPTVGTLVRCLRGALDPRDADRLAHESAAQLVFELALAGALPRPLRVANPPPRLLSLGVGAAVRTPDGATAVVFDGEHVRFEGVDVAWPLARVRQGGAAEVERPYHAVDRSIVLAEVDNNPLALVEAHPDKGGNAVDLGGRSIAAWQDALRDAFARVERHLPALRDEMDLFVQQVVPVGWHAERHLSASYQEAIGTIYVSLHPDPMTMTEAIVHEFSHNKLNALLDLDPVLDNADEEHASPIRPDARPLRGVLLAVHAFIPVARLYEAMIAGADPLASAASFHRRYAEIRAINHAGARELERHARPTALGRGLLDEFVRWEAHFASLGYSARGP